LITSSCYKCKKDNLNDKSEDFVSTTILSLGKKGHQMFFELKFTTK